MGSAKRTRRREHFSWTLVIAIWPAEPLTFSRAVNVALFFPRGRPLAPVA